MTHIEKLDKMLEYIAVNDERRNRHSYDIYKHFENSSLKRKGKVQSDSKEKDETIKNIDKKIEILSIKGDSLTTKQKIIQHD